VSYHEWSKRVPKDVINKFLHEIQVWIKHAKNLGIKVVVLGLTGNHWNQSIWDQIETDKVLNVSKHRFCGMNLRLRDTEHPSNLCLKVLSTQVHDPTSCPCGIPFKDHLNDWHPYGDDQDRMSHRDAMARVYRMLVENGILDFSDTNVEHMYPTDERVEWKRKRKENKEKGIEVKRRTKVVEELYDDCGTNLAGLGDSEILLTLRLQPTDEEPLIKGLSEHWLKGSFWYDTTFNTTCQHAKDMEEMFYLLTNMPDGIDLAEICGGEGRTSVLAISRQLKVGENFDLVTY